MAVTPSSVAVTTGQKIDNVEVTTSEGVVQRQLGVVADPENAAARQAVVSVLPSDSAYGSVIRHPPHNVDTGNVAILVAGAQPLLATFRAAFLFAVNLTDAIVHLTVTDGNDVLYLSGCPLQPRQPLSLPLGGVTFTNGMKWSADVDSAIRAQMVGDL